MTEPPRPPPDLQVHPFSLGDERLVLLSFPVVVDPGEDLGLTPCQREIFALLAAGASSAEIARLRGTSPTTVRKQVSALYRALGVSGRSEFLGRFVRAPSR